MYSFKTLSGEITINQEKCLSCENKPCLEICPPQILKEEEGKVMLGIDEASVKKGKCIECLACELECQFKGNGALSISLPLPEESL